MSENFNDDELENGNDYSEETGESYNESRSSAGKHRHAHESKKEKKGLSGFLIVSVVVLFIIIVVYFSVKNFMPEFLMSNGEKQLEKGEYAKALNTFKTVSNMKPFDVEPLKYEVKALENLPREYENQKMLYEISQLDDYDEASELAEKALDKIRSEFTEKIGSSYIDNVLYDELLIRWNNLEPVTYSVMQSPRMDEARINAAKEAVGSWANASAGLIFFKETPDNPNANIVINFVEGKIPYSKDTNDETYGFSEPETINDTLRKVNVYIKVTDDNGSVLDRNNIFNLVQHQVGHALGLWNHSAYQGDVMSYAGEFPQAYAGPRIISIRDINTLRAVYNMAPDVTDKAYTNEQKDNMYYHPILTAYPGENFKQEIQRLLGLLQRDNKNVVVWVDLAINYAYVGQYQRSIYILKNILPLVGTDNQNQYIVLYNIAVNYYKLKDYANARKYLNFAMNNSDDTETQILDAFIDFKTDGLMELAQRKLTELQKRYPDNIEVSLKLAEIYFKKSDKKGQTETIEKLLKNNPDAIKDRRVAKYMQKENNNQQGGNR